MATKVTYVAYSIFLLDSAGTYSMLSANAVLILRFTWRAPPPTLNPSGDVFNLELLIHLQLSFVQIRNS